jgi:hypothetical protein
MQSPRHVSSVAERTSQGLDPYKFSGQGHAQKAPTHAWPDEVAHGRRPSTVSSLLPMLRREFYLRPSRPHRDLTEAKTPTGFLRPTDQAGLF